MRNDAIKTAAPRVRMAAALLCAACASMGWTAVASAGNGPLIRPAALAPAGVPPGSTALGPVAATQDVDLDVVLPPSNQGGLQALLQNLYDPQSPDYHHWLRPGQFDADFGPSAASVSAVESWLHGAGLTSTSLSGFAVEVSAPAGEVSAALGTPLERYREPSGSAGYLAQEAPLVPQSLAGGQIAAILGLDTVTRLEPQYAPAPAAAATAGSTPLQPDADGLTACSAAQGAADGGSYYTLDQLGSRYGIGSLLADGENGHGETIGVYELASHSSSDVNAYMSCFGLGNTVTTVQVDGGGGTVGGGGTDEADLDIEQAATQAPGAAIIAYEGPNNGPGPYNTWKAIVDADTAQVISTSWGACEPETFVMNELFAKAAADGQTVLAAAGDSGSEGCFADPNDRGDVNLDVDYPASDPSVTAVGGTSLSESGEVAWNWCQSDTLPERLDCAEGEDGGGYGMQAGGGGVSEKESKPSWQPLSMSVPEACGSPPCREVPDISANAGVGMVVYAGGEWVAGAGTSFAAPMLAGLVADANDGCVYPAGLWATALYELAAEGAYPTALNDITQGDNDMTGTNGGEWAAATGYDLATGLGSPEAAGLSCPEITSIQPPFASVGADVTLSGLGLERATISFGGAAADVVSATATTATVVVPAGSGTVAVTGSSVLGAGTQTMSFTYPSDTAYTPLPPFRVCDTRAGTGTECSTGGALGQGQSMTFQVSGVEGPKSQSVPTTATSVVLNVTAISGTAGTYLTVYPAGASPPTASNLNLNAQTNQANLVVVPLNSSGEVSIYNSLGSINVAVDVEGYFAAPVGSSPSGLFHPIAPLRICDTRAGQPANVCNNGGVGPSLPLGSGQWTRVIVSGCPTADPSCPASVPSDGTALAVALNLTAVSGNAGTYLSVVPPITGDACPSGAPPSSSLNVDAQTNLPNRVIVPLGPEQDVCVYNSLGSINFILDVNGWFGNGTELSQGAYFYAITPLRICDTRSAAAVGYSTECSGSSLTTGDSLTVQVAGVDGIPAAGDALAVIANVTAVSGSAFTYFTLYPSDVSLPNASDLNVGAGQNTPNLCVVQLATTGGSAGDLDLYNDEGTINAIVDIAGWFQS